MFDHIEFDVRDFEACQRFYRSALAPLGWVRLFENPTSSAAGYGPQGGPVRFLISRTTSAGSLHKLHVAFEAPTHSAVMAFYQGGIDGGGTDNGLPGIRTSYAPNYFAAFLLDPDGNNIEAVCRSRIER